MRNVLTSSFFVAVVALLPGAWAAEALTIGPLDAAFAGYTNPPSNDGMLADANVDCGGCLVNEVYESDSDSGILGGSYTWSPDGDHSGTLSYDGGSIFTGGNVFVKDGQANPNWYVFDVTALGWNGIDDLVLEGLFVADGVPEGDMNGGISHVSLFGGSTPPPSSVPEPATLSMLSAALVGLGVARRTKGMIA